MWTLGPKVAEQQSMTKLGDLILEGCEPRNGPKHQETEGGPGAYFIWWGAVSGTEQAPRPGTDRCGRQTGGRSEFQMLCGRVGSEHQCTSGRRLRAYLS